jgi:hypothetical protein
MNSKANLHERDVVSDPGIPVDLLAHRKNIYSQSGEDGIIGAILSGFPAVDGWCVEFGAWDGIYLSNTRNLIENRGYRGVLIEANKGSFVKLRENTKDFTEVTIMEAFVGFSEQDGLDVLLSRTVCPRDFDFLSIDVDGNDIHIWRAIEQYRPKLVCIEYNPTIPTEVVFQQPADPKINWGSSLAALVLLGKAKDYELVCANELNAFFVTSELFSRFHLTDNSPTALRPRDAARNMVFSGYDGTLLISGGCIPLPWHGISLSGEDIQAIPAFLRKYPMNYNAAERCGARAYWLFRRARKRLRSRMRQHGPAKGSGTEIGRSS